MCKVYDKFLTLCNDFVRSSGRNWEALSALRTIKSTNSLNIQMLEKWVDVLKVVQDEAEMKKVVKEVQIMDTPATTTTYRKLLIHLATKKEYGLCDELVLDMKRKSVIPEKIQFAQISEQWKDIKQLHGSLQTLRDLYKVPTPENTSTSGVRKLSDSEVEALALKFSQTRTLKEAEPWLLELQKVEQSLGLYNRMLESVTGDETIVWALFKQLKEMGMTPSKFTYNTIISQLCKRQRGMKVISEILLAMKDAGHKPDYVTYNVLIQSRVHARDKKGSLQFFELMKQNGVQPNIITYNEMLKLSKDLHDKAMYDNTKEMLVASGLEINTATKQLLENPGDHRFWSRKPK